MPMICVVYGCTNRSNRETTRSFFRVPKVVVHKGEKCKKLTEKRRKTWLASLQSRAAESENARVCSDHFIRGRPSALFDVECVDWAPTLHLGHQRDTADVQSPKEETVKSTDDLQTRSEVAEALLDLHESTENIENSADAEHHPQDVGCQTDLTMDDIQRMEDILRQTTTELGDLRTKATLSPTCFAFVISNMTT